jgi:hypothetical protein
MASRSQKFHGRVDGAADRCGVTGCGEPGEFRAPVSPGDFDGPGEWRYLCLDHVRAHNSSYNYFTGMTRDEIQEAQSPIAGWERHSRVFAHLGTDPPPAWSDFSDPLDAIAERTAVRTSATPSLRSVSRLTSAAHCARSSCARMSTAPGCANAIPSWSAAITPTATAATAATSAHWAR